MLAKVIVTENEEEMKNNVIRYFTMKYKVIEILYIIVQERVWHFFLTTRLENDRKPCFYGIKWWSKKVVQTVVQWSKMVNYAFLPAELEPDRWSDPPPPGPLDTTGKIL